MSYNNSVLHGPFLKNVLTLFSGSSLAQLVGLAFMPLLTRLFTPGEFGIFYLFLTIASILSLIITGGYEKTFVLPSSDKDANKLILFSFGFLFFSTMILFLVAALLSNWSDSIFHTERSRLIIWLIPVYSFLLASVRLFQNWLIRGERYKDVSASNIIRNGSFSALQTGFGFLSYGSCGLVLGSCLGQVFPLAYIIFRGKGSLTKVNRKEISESYIIGRKFRDFPVYKMPADLVNELSIQSPVFVFSYLFSNAVTGMYTLPARLLNQPSRFIGQAAGEVYYRQASELNSDGKNIADLTYSLFRFLFLLGIIPFSIISLWGEGIFSFVFGAEWEFSGRIAAWLSPWLLFVFAGSPVSGIFLIKNKLRLSFIMNSILLVTRIAALLTGALILRDLNMTIILFALISVIYWIFISIFSLSLAGVPVWKPLIFIVVTVVPAIFILGIIKFFVP
ncbi:MAG: oligosaccharide flippase family protein [Bacteroidales bacterium]|nr:oligosaccharide flippase family protein [Bacteroidales bacterium]